MYIKFVSFLIFIFVQSNQISASELLSVAFADENIIIEETSSTKIIDGKRKRLNLDLPFEDQIAEHMPRDNQRDNIYEGLSRDLYYLMIRY